jgi:hypothetical protein
MSTISEFLQIKKMDQTTKIIENFINRSFRYLISHERKGRIEYIEALGNLTQPSITNQPVNELMKRN